MKELETALNQNKLIIDLIKDKLENIDLHLNE